MATDYEQKLRDPRWQRCRLEIMQRDNFACIECGDTESTLNVHHIRYIRGALPWAYPPWLLVTLCESCHEAIHDGEPTIDERFFSLARVIGMETAHFTMLEDALSTCLHTRAGKLTPAQWNVAITAFYFAIRDCLPDDIYTPESRQILEEHLAHLYPTGEQRADCGAENG
jgi:hypothetical protein